MRRHFVVVLCLTSLCGLGGCITIAAPDFKSCISYEPLPAGISLDATASVEATHRVSPEMRERWKAWFNNAETIANWERAMADVVAEDVIRSHVFTRAERGLTSADIVVRVETEETVADDGQRLVIAMSVSQPSTGATLFRGRRSAKPAAGLFGVRFDDVKDLLRTELAALRGELASTLAAVDLRSPSAGAMAAVAPATGPADAGKPPRPAFTGVYSLQALIDFDTLDGASYDPGSGTLSLFGHRSSRSRFVPVAYLDLLATAIDSRDPTFSLEWTRESEDRVARAMEEFDRNTIARLARWWEGGRLTALGAWWLRAGGADVSEGMLQRDAIAAMMRATGRGEAAEAWTLLWKFVEADAAGKQGVFDALIRSLGIAERTGAAARKYRKGEISEAQLHDASFPLLLEALAKRFERDPAAFVDVYWQRRRGGLSGDGAWGAAMERFDAPDAMKPLLSQMLDELIFRRVTRVHLPPERVAELLGARPVVRPLATGLEPRSLLARVAFEADVFCKSLLDMPELTETVPGYRTYFEYRRTQSGARTNSEGHLWIAPGPFEFTESADGTSIRFVRTPVRIHLERYASGRSTPDPVLDGYARELTTQYDAIAASHPILHEVRECMKVVAVARWLSTRGIAVGLPASGRAEWDPPAQIPGVVHIALGDESGSVGMVMSAMGGIDLRVDREWRRVPAAAGNEIVLDRERIVVPSLKSTDDRIQKLCKFSEPPPPEIGGNVARARFGKDALSYVAVRSSGLQAGVDAAEAVLILQRMEKRARLIQHYDDLLNARMRSREEGVPELERLRGRAHEWAAGAGEEAVDLLLNMADGSRELRDLLRGAPTSLPEEVRSVRELSDWVDRWRERVEKTQRAVEVARTGTIVEDDLRDAVEDLTDLALEHRERLRVLGGAAPRVAKYVALRSSLLATGVYGTERSLDRLHEILDLHRMTAEISDALGAQAIEIEQIRLRREALIADYVKDKRRLEAVQGGERE